MWKAIVAGTAALAISGTSLVCAQQSGRPDGVQRWRPSAEDLRAFGEARLAALKAGLSLTPEQARNWPAFEQAARDFGKLRIDRRIALRSTPPSNDPVERLRRRATAMSDTGAVLKKLADATEPLYKSLDENQKRRFAVLNRLTAPAGIISAAVRATSHYAGVRARQNALANSVCSCCPSSVPTLASSTL